MGRSFSMCFCKGTEESVTTELIKVPSYKKAPRLHTSRRRAKCRVHTRLRAKQSHNSTLFSLVGRLRKGTWQINAEPRSASVGSGGGCQFLNAYQRHILRYSWFTISQISAHTELGMQTYIRILTLQPELRSMFTWNDFDPARMKQSPKFQHQSKAVINVIDRCVNNLDQIESKMTPELIQLGKRHARFRGFGFSPAHWEVFLKCIMETIEDNLDKNAKDYLNVVDVWQVLIRYIVDTMHDGYDSMVRSQSTNIQDMYSCTLETLDHYNSGNLAENSKQASQMLLKWMETNQEKSNKPSRSASAQIHSLSCHDAISECNSEEERSSSDSSSDEDDDDDDDGNEGSDNDDDGDDNSDVYDKNRVHSSAPRGSKQTCDSLGIFSNGSKLSNCSSAVTVPSDFLNDFY